MKRTTLAFAIVSAFWSLFCQEPTLNQYIRNVQVQRVRASYGPLAHQCFTDADLNQFKRREIASEVVQEATRSPVFYSIIKALRARSRPDRDRILREALRQARPTWAEIGEISSRGQTVAGRTAERLLADALVELADRMSQGDAVNPLRPLGSPRERVTP